MRKIENMMLTVFLVVSLICGKFLLDYWQDSYDNRQNYRQAEEIAFPEKDTGCACVRKPYKGWAI